MQQTEISVETPGKQIMLDITPDVQKFVRSTGIKEGICHLFCLHTTAGLTINENADPAVRRDIIMELGKIAPFANGYSHLEGNADAHIKSTLVGCSETLIISNGRPILGTWQSVFFCEFDGPRTRRVWIEVMGE